MVSTVVLSFTMKLLLLVLALLFCIFSNAMGLKCYECINVSVINECKQTKVITCDRQTSQKYCLKADYERVDEDQFRYCNENCTYKGCIHEAYEKICESGTFNISQAISEWKGTAYCCEGNLCNSENEVYNKKTNGKTLRNQTFVSTTSVSLLKSISSGTTNTTTSVSLINSGSSDTTNSTTLVSLLNSRSSGTTNVKNFLFYAFILVNTLDFVEYLFI